MGQRGSRAEEAEVIHLGPSIAFETEALIVTSNTGDTATCCRASHVTLPQLQCGQLLVRVLAAGLNPSDTRRVRFPEQTYSRDTPHALPRLPMPYILGADGAGVVEQVGSDDIAAMFPVGSRIYFHQNPASPFGSLSKVTIVDSRSAAMIPEGVSPECAAALPTASWGAYIALYDKLRIERGRTIYIHGASGGVGTTAIQLAKASGCTVIASCSRHNIEYVRQLGADITIDYATQDVAEALLQSTNQYGVDYAIDLVDSDSVYRYAHAIRFGGALCLLCGPCHVTPEYFFTQQLSVHCVYLAGLHRSDFTKPLLGHLGTQVAQLIQSGAFAPEVESVKWDQACDALDQLGSGHTRGKLVVSIPKG